MNTQLIITLAVLIFMAVSFMVRKISFGLTGMICMLALAVTGVIDLNTAFSGFSNKKVGAPPEGKTPCPLIHFLQLAFPSVLLTDL